jgi:hypothetical protein
VRDADEESIDPWRRKSRHADSGEDDRAIGSEIANDDEQWQPVSPLCVHVWWEIEKATNTFSGEWRLCAKLVDRALRMRP